MFLTSASLLTGTALHAPPLIGSLTGARPTGNPRVRWYDRPWLDDSTVTVCGPFDLPPESAFREAVLRTAAEQPRNRLLRERGVAPATLVTTREQPADIGELLDAVATDDQLAWPLAIVRCGDYLALRYSPTVSDADLIGRTTRSILSAAFNSRPERLATATRTDADLPRPRTGPSGRRTVTATMSAERHTTLREWAAENAPRASRFAVVVAGLARALDDVGFAYASEATRIAFEVGRDRRRSGLTGNWPAGRPLRLPLRPSPAQVQTAAQTATPRLRPTPTRVGLPRMTFYHLGRPPAAAYLPFLPGQPVTCTGSLAPGGPRDVAALILECRGALQLSMSCQSDGADPALLRAALNRFTGDPVATLR